jgi:hypothetical protein
MYPNNALSEAASIARAARLNADREDIEEAVRDAERSTVPVLQSLARAYRMLQNPFK